MSAPRKEGHVPEKTETEVPETKTFEQLVKEQRNGGLAAELSQAIADVAFGVQQHQKQGTVAVKLTVSPGETPGTVTVEDQVAVKVPEPAKPKTLFFADEAGNLTRRNPAQATLPVDDKE